MKPLILLLSVCSFAAVANAQTPAITPTPHPTPTPVRPADANNTARNAGDARNPEATADGQSNSKSDLALVQSIRANVISDKSLSTTAKNCKIVVRDGSVMLRGPVENQREKETIAMIAKRAAGNNKVTDELEVKMASK